MWTHFWDMNSGGGQKLDAGHIYIEAPESEARAIFYSRFGRNPDRVTCTCCGSDYSISEYETLEEATEYQRKGFLGNKPVQPLEEYAKNEDVLIIYATDIKGEERHTDVPQEGYVWMG